MKKYFITAAIILAVLGCGFIALQRKDNKMDNLAVTDPDLALIRKNFIEQEVLPHGKRQNPLSGFAGVTCCHTVAERI